MTGFVVLNPVSGKGSPEQVRDALRSSLGKEAYDLYETTGEESVREVVKGALRAENYAWVAAAGGDGTVTQVADAVVGTEIPLAIIPAGTGNVLAQELGIPDEIEPACALLKNTLTTRLIDAIQVENQYFFLQLGVGLESVTMKKTSSSQKNRWGLLAYLWTAVKEAFGWQPYRFSLTIDGETHHMGASELVIANSSRIGVSDLKWADTIKPDDGRLDIAVVQVRSFLDYMRLIWALIGGRQHDSSHIKLFTAYESVRLEAERPLPLHGDGEVLEIEMPLTAVIVPDALQIIVPETKQQR